MLKVHKINKTYNRNKRNALLALDSVEVTFPEKGLVVLLGESGSGKTTLLNVIGGMDAFDSGELFINEQAITRYRSNTLDTIRSNTIGMVFQNYYLLPNETVYENIAITLRLVGITDHTDINNRIDYLLDAVGLPKYKKRLANQLSGGEQQRVAIARALAKNPSLLLADEPTGNLDSKNTLAIMDIIKQVSSEKLVIMVTHERELADYYADRIIELEDGKIIQDKENTSNGELDYSTGNDIYLGDLTHQSTNTKSAEIDIYTDNESVTLKPKLIYLNGTLYLDLQNTPVKKLVNIKDRPDINIHHTASGEVVKADIKPFDFDRISETKPKEKAVDPIHFKTVFNQTMQKFFSATRGQKLLFFSFGIGAMILTYAIASIFNVITVRDDDFLVLPKEAIQINQDAYTYDDLITISEHQSVDTVMILETVTMTFQLPQIFARYDLEQYITSPIIDYNRLSERDLTYGRLPSNAYEVVVDAGWVRKHIHLEDPFHSLNITKAEEILNFTLLIPVGNEAVQVDIVGVVDLETPVIYGHPSLMTDLAVYQFSIYELHESTLEIIKGVSPTNAKEILFPANHVDEALRNNFAPFTVTFTEVDYTVVGLYEMDNVDAENPVMLHSDAERYIFTQTGGATRPRYVIPNNLNQALSYLSSLDFETDHIYQSTRTDYLSRQIQESRPMLVFSGFIIGAMVLSFYFVIRSSMIHRIYEIGVFRSLGTKKRHILKRFAYESAIITTFSSLIGFILMNYILISTQSALGDNLRIVYISLQSIIVGIIIIYAINVLSGLLPVWVLLRKTPAKINTQYDV